VNKLSLPTRRSDRLAVLGSEIERLADHARAGSVRRIVPGARTNGAPVPNLRALAKKMALAKDAAGFEDACFLMDALCRNGSREHVLVGIFMVGRHRRFVKTLPWVRVIPWLDAIDNWETCDQLAAEVLAAMVDADPGLGRSLLRLAAEANMWHRRLAVATAACVNQRGRSQPSITRDVCDALEHDPSPMIRRAVAWARRELAKSGATLGR
jgi:3-methyladenine DNA glycosylase AlkD